MEKEFKTIREQIEILKSRNMKIINNTSAFHILAKNNYYYLINGYKHLFLNKGSTFEKYIDNVKLEELFALYTFDKNIKMTFLKYILFLETEINHYLAYEFSKLYGHKNYLVQENFNHTHPNIPRIKKFINDINLEIKFQYKNSNPMIVHYIDNYHYIPLWVLVRILSFGKISKFYSLMKPKEQNAISRKYNLKINEYKIYLQNLTIVRNICAHDEKLYDIKMKSRILPTYYHTQLSIKKTNTYQYATRDLFSVVIILKVLLEKEQFDDFYHNILIDIEKLENALSSISIHKVLYQMGFPRNYKKLLEL